MSESRQLELLRDKARQYAQVNSHETVGSAVGALVGLFCERAIADLRSAGEQQEQREPDAVWVLDLMPFGLHLSYGNGTGAQVLPNDMANTHAVLGALLAGRERVRLRVYVEEEGK